MRAGIARDEVAERIRDRFDEGQRHAHGQRDAEGIPQPGGVLDRRVAFGAADVDLERAVGPLQGSEVARAASAACRPRTAAASRLGRRPDSAASDAAAGVRAPREARPSAAASAGSSRAATSSGAERTQQAQQVRDAFQSADLAVRGQPLQFALGRRR